MSYVAIRDYLSTLLSTAVGLNVVSGDLDAIFNSSYAQKTLADPNGKILNFISLDLSCSLAFRPCQQIRETWLIVINRYIEDQPGVNNTESLFTDKQIIVQALNTDLFLKGTVDYFNYTFDNSNVDRILQRDKVFNTISITIEAIKDRNI